MLNLLNRRLMDIHLGDHVVVTANSCFDASSLEIWNYLSNGANIFILTAHLADTESVVDFFREKRIQKAFLPTAVFHRLVNDNKIAASLGSTLSWILVGGERLSTASVRNFFRYAPQTKLLNGYGSAETTVHVTDFDVPRDLSKYDEMAGRPIPVGRAIDNASVFVLDEDLHPVASGSCGEICVSGAGLARGYLGESLSVSEKFGTFHLYSSA
jgi:non-ribosomal peptide synthetase component F